jgi:hypothetical protein
VFTTLQKTEQQQRLREGLRNMLNLLLLNGKFNEIIQINIGNNANLFIFKLEWEEVQVWIFVLPHFNN